MKSLKWVAVMVVAVAIAWFLQSTSEERDSAERGLDEMSKKDLYRRAQDAGIAGRSQMTKAELLRALRTTAALEAGSSPVLVEAAR